MGEYFRFALRMPWHARNKASVSDDGARAL
ncbi:Uncharacterised protein [Mycobacterium tuberculosis]|nr:Uncharacterised protein [Mycobacterium tuberculosis]